MIEYTRCPHYVCKECADKATDVQGRKLDFFNLGIAGGYGAQYVDTHEECQSQECYIHGIKCWADEARFGGIVIQKVVE